MQATNDNLSQAMHGTSSSSSQQYRLAVEAVKRLDGALTHTKRCQDLFQPEVSSLRLRLRELCEKLIFCSNSALAAKAEEFLWRKVYYEVINFIKLHRKKGDGHADTAVKMHILSGIGTYHLLIKRLQVEAEDEFEQTRESARHHKTMKSLFKFHIALGDLTRYQADFSNPDLRRLAENYYKDAFILNPDAGLPFNQLGTLYAGFNYGLDSVYYYMRGLLTDHPFDGTETNLLRLLERNRKTYTDVTLNMAQDSQVTRVRKFIVYFLRLVEIFYSCPNSDSGLSDLCQDMLQDLPECLPPHKSLVALPTLEFIPVYLNPELAFKIIVILEMCFIHLQAKGNFLTSAAVAFLFAFLSHIVFYSISACNTLLPQLQLHSSASSSEKQATSKVLAKTDSSDSIQKISSRLLRRRRREATKDDDSDQSEDEDVASLCSSMDSDLVISDSIDGEDDLEVLSESGDSKDKSSLIDSTAARLNASAELALQVVELALEESPPNDSLSNVQPTDCNSSEPDSCSLESHMNVLHILGQKGYLFAMKNFCDWLKSAPEFLKNCANSSQLLWCRIANLVNILQFEVVPYVKDKARDEILNELDDENSLEWFQAYLLPEDILIHKFPGLQEQQAKFNISINRKVSLNNFEQVILRVQSLHQFCKFLIQLCPDINISYDDKECKFMLPNGLKDSAVQTQSWLAPSSENDQENKKEMMQNMTQLWLKAEVSDLENKVQVNSSKVFSPYLVPHSAILVHHLPTVRHLASSKRFVVVVPRTVIETLDALKKSSMKAREASRWLEAELKRGNRFLRAQNQHEKLSLSPLKYPRKKDKQLWDSYQILECCNYLCQKSSFTSSQKSGENVPIVTMLVSRSKGPDGNIEVDVDAIEGVALSIGVNIEDVKVFYSQVFSKSKGKR